MSTKLIIKNDGNVICEFEGQHRVIGSFHDNIVWCDGTIKDNVFCCVRSSKKHFMKKYYGFGFNYDLIEQSDINFKYIMMTTGTMKHFLTRDFVISVGIFDDAIKGFEPQIFVPANLMTRMSRKKYQSMTENINHGK